MKTRPMIAAPARWLATSGALVLAAALVLSGVTIGGDDGGQPFDPATQAAWLEQHFRCEPYHCTLTAGACVDRQAQRVFVHSSGGSKVRYLACQDCAVGARIAKRVPAEAKTLRQNEETKHVSKLEMQRRRALWG